jgi:hypothetical protein
VAQFFPITPDAAPPQQKQNHSQFLDNDEDVAAWLASPLYLPDAPCVPAGEASEPVPLSSLVARGDCYFKFSNCTTSSEREKAVYMDCEELRPLLVASCAAYSDSFDNYVNLLVVKKYADVPEAEMPACLERVSAFLDGIHAAGICHTSVRGTFEPVACEGSYYLTRFDRVVRVPPGGAGTAVRLDGPDPDIVSGDGIFIPEKCVYQAAVLKSMLACYMADRPFPGVQYSTFVDTDNVTFNATVLEHMGAAAGAPLLRPL